MPVHGDGGVPRYATFCGGRLPLSACSVVLLPMEAFLLHVFFGNRMPCIPVSDDEYYLYYYSVMCNSILDTRVLLLCPM